MSTSSTIIDRTNPPTLRLDANNRAGGFAGCNRYFAGFRLRGDSLSFSEIGATRMYCAATDHVERVFLTILERTRTYTISDSELTLRSHDGLEAIFRPATKRSSK
jgi:heat shock protein HslJ